MQYYCFIIVVSTTMVCTMDISTPSKYYLKTIAELTFFQVSIYFSLPDKVPSMDYLILLSNIPSIL